MTSEERYVLNAEWYDAQACITRPFFIQYYPFDGAIDIVSLTRERDLTVIVRCQAKENVSEKNAFAASNGEIASYRFDPDYFHTAVQDSRLC